MPVVPQPNAQGIVRSFGFAFNFSDAFATTAEAQGIPVDTSFSTLQASLGVPADLYPAQQTAWGRANQANIASGNALTTSQDALTNADGALEVATSADGIANSALESANTAQTTANTAQTTADTAQATADTANNAFINLTTANASGQVGTVGDAEAINTSLWAYSKQAYADAQAGATVANNAFTLAGNAQTTANTANNAFITLTTANASGQVGTSTDTISQSTSLWALAKYVSAQLPRYEYGSASTVSALTTSYVGYNNITLTTNTASARIIAWGAVDITDGGSGSTVQVRMVITPTGQPAQYSIVREINITNGHRQNLAYMSQGTGFSTPGDVGIKIECRVVAGTANFIFSQITAVANPIEA